MPDSTRGQMLAAAAKLDSMHPKYDMRKALPRIPAKLIAQGEAGAAIVVGVVQADGYVDLPTRTVVYMDGDYDFAKITCEVMSRTVFSSPSGDVTGKLAYYPFSVDNGGVRINGGPPTQTGHPVGEKLKSEQPGIVRRIKDSTVADLSAWFATSPTCDQIAAPKSGATKTVAMGAPVPDSVQREAENLYRGARLARARFTAPTRPEFQTGSSKLVFPQEARGEGTESTVILSYVVMPNGRVDRDSRTVVYLKGPSLYAKAACDFLLGAQYKLGSADSATVTQSFSFTVYNGTPRETVRADAQQMGADVDRKIRSMTVDEATEWFAKRPPCSVLKGSLVRAP